MREQDGARTHTQYMLAFIDEVLREVECAVTDLDAIVFAAGPGSFTGVRLAASVAKALAFAANIPVIPVSSLAAIAQTTARITASTEPCLVITDARMGEIYVAEYGFDIDGVAKVLRPDVLMSLEQVQSLQIHAKRLAGDALPLLQHVTWVSGIHGITQTAHAQDLLRLGERAFKDKQTETALAAQAIYLRDKTSWKNITQQQEEKLLHLKR